MYEINGREERIRTSGPIVPNDVLYQTEPLPDLDKKHDTVSCSLRYFLTNSVGQFTSWFKFGNLFCGNIHQFFCLRIFCFSCRTIND